jgi:hypothetical protein
MGSLPYATKEHQQLHWKMTKSYRKNAQKRNQEFHWVRPSVGVHRPPCTRTVSLILPSSQ